MTFRQIDQLAAIVAKYLGDPKFMEALDNAKAKKQGEQQ
jgi:hypothetical protein